MFVANSSEGSKILYDILPNKKVEKAGNSAKTSTNSNIASSSEESKKSISDGLNIQDGNASKFSISDADYMETVDRNDTKTAQKMVDNAARDSGFTVKGYHGYMMGRKYRIV